MANDLKAIIFDFNGVIVDDEPFHLELFRRVLGEEGLALSEADYQKKYLGSDDRGCFTAALTDAGRLTEARQPDYIEQLITRKAAYYREAIGRRVLLFPGVGSLVRRLAPSYPLAIASGALRDEIEMVLEHGQIRDHFRVIIAAEDVSACKPDPEGYLKALTGLNRSFPDRPPVEPHQCLVIEDSLAGVEAAKRAGMRCLAVTNSYRADELVQADWIVSTLGDCEPQDLFKGL